MSTIAISSLPVATVINAPDVLPIVQSGVTKQLSKTALFADLTLTSATLDNPELIAPDLGVPVAGILTNCTGLPNAGLLYSSITFGGTVLALGTATSTIANDVTFNGVNIGRGLASAATNTALGNGTLGAVTTGTNLTAVGASALFSNTTGARNSAVGTRALTTNTTGQNNVAVGTQSLDSNLSGNANVGIGTDTLFTGTTSTGNIGIGFAALYNNTGSANIAIGGSSLYNNTTGFNNVAVGVDSMFTNTTGDGCVAIGVNALRLNLSGDQNTAVGFEALETNSIGSNNVAMGFQALNAATGSSNVAVGHIALVGNTTGFANTAIGKSALGACTTGAGNTGINPMNSSNDYAPVFDVTTENNRFVAGSTAVTNAYIQVAWTVVSDARDKTDFAPVPHGLDFVTKLQPTAYRYKANRSDTEGHGPLRYGFKAQDVLALEGDNPVIVDAEVPEKLKLNDQSMIAVLVNAIQELKAEFDAYKAAHP